MAPFKIQSLLIFQQISRLKFCMRDFYLPSPFWNSLNKQVRNISSSTDKLCRETGDVREKGGARNSSVVPLNSQVRKGILPLLSWKHNILLILQKKPLSYVSVLIVRLQLQLGCEFLSVCDVLIVRNKNLAAFWREFIKLYNEFS